MRAMVVLGLMVVAGCAGGRGVEVIAHRGASHLGPENTLAAVELAWELGADGVEIDVRRSADGRAVLMHDATTKRTAGVELAVAETGAGELRRLDVGRFKGEQWAGERVPFVEEVLATVPAGRRLFVEIKCGPEVVAGLTRAVEGSGKMGQVVVISFDIEAAAAAKEAMPGVPVYWLVGSQRDKQTKEFLPHDAAKLAVAAERGLDGLDVHYAGVTAEFMAAVRAAGQELYVWTVDDPEEARRLVELGVAGITTNRPGFLREELAAD